jgi:hypothetical protein
MTLEPHQQLVVEEKNNVSERLAKLLGFFQGPLFPTLDEAERARLRNQARFMDGYAAVLEERIAAFRVRADETGEIQHLRASVAEARDTFQKYAELHRAKGTPEGNAKAAANAELAARMDAALRHNARLSGRQRP